MSFSLKINKVMSFSLKDKTVSFSLQKEKNMSFSGSDLSQSRFRVFSYKLRRHQDAVSPASNVKDATDPTTIQALVV